MSDKPQVPEKSGEWWAWKPLGEKASQIGRSRLSSNGSGLVVESKEFIVWQKYFSHYEWHRIDLPEGWE